jgi:hypothetical protein
MKKADKKLVEEMLSQLDQKVLKKSLKRMNFKKN